VNDPKNIESFDNLFKQAFDGVKTPAPEGLWEGIAASTTGSTVASTGLIAKLFGIKGAAIIGSVVVITAAVATFYLTKTDTVPEQNTTPTIEIENKLEQEATKSNKNETVVDSDNGNQADLVEVQSADIANTPSQTEENSPILEPNTRSTPISTEEIEGDHTLPKSTPLGSQVTIPAEVLLHTSAEKLCLNQDVHAKVTSNKEIANISWSLNNLQIAEGINELTVILTNSGINTVKVKVELENGSIIERSKTMVVEKMSASFAYKLEGQTLSLAAENGSASHAWYVNNVRLAENSANVNTTISDKNELEVIHISNNFRGCADTVIQSISLSSCDFEPVIFDVFSPDLQDGINVQDGINDEWVIEMPPVEWYYLIIFARDGSTVFESSDQKINWNGKLLNQFEMMPTGVYTFQLIYKCGGNDKSQSGKLVMR
jgi:CHU_C Type IX secretion signal domain